jgi:hypothetical protein
LLYRFFSDILKTRYGFVAKGFTSACFNIFNIFVKYLIAVMISSFIFYFLFSASGLRFSVL